jgi:2',3'-cyclic-nucleotide 2'-phosphodiesterase / 3'-nucleotidase
MPVETYRLTVLATSDVHSHILDWDYFTDRPYADSDGNHVGLARLSTLINRVRAERPAGSVLVVDNGDTIEGTPLAYYYARVAPHEPHPMALAMNAMGYDAAAIGNHEFNYGLNTLGSFAAQADFPMLCANVTDERTGETAFPARLLHRIETAAGPLTVGLLGLVTPGCALWDRASLQGTLRLQGIVEQARVSVPALKAAGADVIVVLCHSGADTSSSYGDALPWPENAAGTLAEEVADIDAVVVGHAHQEIAQRLVVNRVTGRQVPLSEPGKWAMRLSQFDLDLQHSAHGWQVVAAGSQLLDARDAEADPVVVAAVNAQHEAVRGYVNSVIGSCAAPMTTARSRYESTPVIELINRVQATAVAGALVGTEWADLPVLAVAAAFTPGAGIPAGDITVRDIAGFYNYENTLVGVLLTGEQLRSYLEHAARYFQSVSGGGPCEPGQVTNAIVATAPHGLPDYSYDMVSALDSGLHYDIDLSRPVGSRISRLDYAGSPVTAADRFVLALNNYRQSGGGGYPAVTTAPVVYDELAEIRQLIIDWVRRERLLDPAEFGNGSWRLVADGQALIVS